MDNDFTLHTPLRDDSDQSFTTASPDSIIEHSLASPVLDEDDDEVQLGSPQSHSLGQFSFAPATETTVVTTTTTTTTSFPPFLLNAPKNLKSRDPERFPLATSSTPDTIKHLRINVGGRNAIFEEAPNADQKLHEYESEQQALRLHNGKIQRSQPLGYPSQKLLAPSKSKPSTASNERRSRRLKSATPISASDATELHSFHRRNTKPRVSPLQTHPFSRESRGQSSLVKTPSDSALEDDSSEDGAQDLPEALEKSPKLTRFVGEMDDQDVVRRKVVSKDGSPILPDTNLVQSTSPIESDLEECADVSHETTNAIPAAFSSSFSGPPREPSLPSPRLSPVSRSRSRLESNYAPRKEFHGSRSSPAQSNRLRRTLGTRDLIPTGRTNDIREKQSELHERALGPTGGIPDMLDSFDSMPDAMKTYMMYQFLRRCPKPTLHFVLGVVDPALRCDFLARLPPELGINVIKFLDAKSLCRAAQVSRRWRVLIDTDERTWKRLFVRDGYSLPEGELEKALKCGWGWQYPLWNWNEDWEDYEKNIRHKCQKRQDVHQLLHAQMLERHPKGLTLPPNNSLLREISMEEDAPCEYKMCAMQDQIDALQNSRKRKNKAKQIGQNKKQKRRESTYDPLAPPLSRDLEKLYGPAALAAAAATLVPDPNVGLPTLRHLHLHKTLYQRHHMIRQNWKDPNSEPLHLAFRAHQRHVVTCLQFDRDKIITGSDDSNIDIYDTRRGASVKRLVGHDGGVWALEYQDDTLVSGSTDRSVRVWNMKEGRNTHIFQGHTSTVRCLQILKPVQVGVETDGLPIMKPPYPLIITGSRDSTCRVWRLPKPTDPHFRQNSLASYDRENPYYLRTLNGHSNSVRAIAAYADTLVSGSYDSVVRVWKVSTGECVHRLQGHTSKVYSVVLDHRRRRCISGSMDNMVKVWSVETGTCLFNLDGHSSLVGLLDLRDDILVSAAADATLRVWDPETGRCRNILNAHTGAITCFLHDAQKIISGSDKTLKMWDTSTGECVRDLLTDLSGVWQIKFDDRRCVAAVQRDDWTYIEVLDFGAGRDGVPLAQLGKRRVVDFQGNELEGTRDGEGPESAIQIAD